MATYKQPCIQCGAMIERDSHFCEKCGSRNPFVYLCPSCLKIIEQGNAVCSGCGRPLTTICPYCGGVTFIGSDHCDACGRLLMKQCQNKRCGKMQYFDLMKCTACGKKLKAMDL